MKVFIDFDDVLLNTKQFVGNLQVFFASNGVGEDLFRKHYYDCSGCSQVKLFNPWALIDRLEKDEGLDVGELRMKFGEHIKDLSQFVFFDVKDFLTYVGKENAFLISFGLPEFQNEKIVACGFDKLVNGCIVTKGLKSVAISSVIEQLKIGQDEKLVFIDDRAEQIQDVKKNFPHATTFLLCRREGRYCDPRNEYCDYEVHSLIEVQKVLADV